MTEQKFKIYKGIICLETPSPTGHLWWYQGETLAFSPCQVTDISRVIYGVLEGSQRRVLAATLKTGGQRQMVAINLPRSDIPALKARYLWPEGLSAPVEHPVYSPPPTKNGM